MLYCVRFKSSASLIRTCNEPEFISSLMTDDDDDDDIAKSSCFIATNKPPFT